MGERQRRKKIDDEFAEKMKKAEESKLVIMPAILPKKEEPEEESEEEEEDPSKPKKKITDVFNERKERKKPEGQKITIKPKDLSKMQSKFVKVDLPEDTGPVRRKKKPVVEVESAPPVVEEELLEAPEEIVEVESAPPAQKDKVSEEFKEKEKKPKEDEKIVIKPAKLRTKK